MKVADLAAELEVPASTILDQCQRFGIDATWAGAELSGTDVVVIRSELASGEPLDLTRADPPAVEAPAPVETADAETVEAEADAPEPESEPVAEPEAPAPAPAPAPAALPPTAVGSLPDLIDEVTPEPEPDEPVVEERTPGFSMAGSASGGSVDPNAARTDAPREQRTTRRVERSVRGAVVALVIAVVAFAASNFIELAAVVALLWFIAAVALAVAVIDGIRGRRRVQTHPDRLSGVWLASLTIVLAIGGIVGLTTSVVTAVGEEPAAAAPAGVGDLASVKTARWGYHRVRRIAETDWHEPAREAGSCWAADPDDEDRIREVDDRVELQDLAERVACDHSHTLEVAKVFAVDRDADSPYPGTDGLVVLAKDACGPLVDRLTEKGVEVELKIEYPTDIGWRAADHDVACVLVTPKRSGSLLD